MSYMDILGSISPSFGGVQRAADIVAALAPPTAAVLPTTGGTAAPGAGSMVPSSQHGGGGKSVMTTVKAFAPDAAGAAVGYVVGKKYFRHPYLGAVAGHALGSTMMELLHGNRTRALCQIAVEAAGIYGAMKYKKSPALGFVGGLVAGAVVTSFVKESPTRDLYANIKARF